MYKNVLQNIDNIAIWPLVSFVIFFLFFLCLIWWTFTADKKYIAHMSNMPIGDKEEGTQNSETKTEKI